MMNYPRAIPMVASLLACIMTVRAHGFVKNIVINGVSYQGYDPTVFPYQSNPPIVVGWTTSQTDLGYVEPAAFGSSDIICHRGSKPAEGYARVAAGDSVALTWNTWPDSHHGPIIDYLAPCNGPCESVDKTALKFFKIDGVGKADPSATSSPGYWADDVMMSNGLTWLVRIPASIAPGNYVLRHEIIALHSANNANGAQAYPQCFNLEITGSGTAVPDGVPGTQLYNINDPGILYNLYTTPQPPYTVPGPTLIAGVPLSVAQSSSAVIKSTSATVGYSPVNSASSFTTTTVPDSEDNTSSFTTTSTASTTSSSSSTPSKTISSTTTTSSTSTITDVTTGSVPSQSLVPLYAQCGGRNWQGSSQCAQQKVVCQYSNDYYSQCVPVPA